MVCSAVICTADLADVGRVLAQDVGGEVGLADDNLARADTRRAQAEDSLAYSERLVVVDFGDDRNRAFGAQPAQVRVRHAHDELLDAPRAGAFWLQSERQPVQREVACVDGERLEPSLRQSVDAVGFKFHGERAVANALADFARRALFDLSDRPASQRQHDGEQREPLAPHRAPSNRANSLRMSWFVGKFSCIRRSSSTAR
jgi:hypothetical protein